MRALILSLILCSCTLPTKARVGAMMVGNAAILCDWSQTLWMSNGGKWDRGSRELNPLLGPAPSDTQIHTANALALVANTALTLMLKPKWASVFSVSVAGIEGANVLTQPSNPVWKWHEQGPCRI